MHFPLSSPSRIAKSFYRLSKRRISTKASGDEHLFSYTSGRWLWNEQRQLAARYRRFDVQGLNKEACHALKAASCVSIVKIGEGGFSKAFRLTMQDGQKLIAKIPNPNAGPPRYTTASEVATMEFGRDVLNLPIPKVIAWSSTSLNPVGAEYILMEEAQGTPLSQVWDDMGIEIKREVIYQIVEIERKLLSLSFSLQVSAHAAHIHHGADPCFRHGSLYFREDQITGAQPATITTDVSEEIRKKVASRFCIGPSTQRELWAEERADMHKYHGPWASAFEYLNSLTCCEIDWLSQYANKKDETYHPLIQTSKEHQSPQAHVDLLRKLLSVLTHLIPKDQEITSARPWHPDFHSGNIFVDSKGQITSVIDWQGAWLGPVFVTANLPKMLDYEIDMLLKLPDNFRQLSEETKEKLRYQVAQSILIHAYETRSARTNPVMYRMMRHLHIKTIKETIAFISGTWQHGLLPLKDCLIRIQRDWDDFQAETPCPYQFSSAEIKSHQEEGGSYNDNADLWSSLGALVRMDGYTSNADFPRAIEAFKQLRQIGLQELAGEEREEFDKTTRWILDIKA